MRYLAVATVVKWQADGALRAGCPAPWLHWRRCYFAASLGRGAAVTSAVPAVRTMFRINWYAESGA